LERAV
jgi:Papain family cysteine protease